MKTHMAKIPRTLTTSAEKRRKKRFLYVRRKMMQIWCGFRRPHKARYYDQGIVYHRHINVAL